MATETPYSKRTMQQALIRWYKKHGRNDLPWQQHKTPYTIWISEIMLQQTQVATVIPYFSHFIQRFPTLNSLANALEDEVLHLWTGLGYYSRARHLHRAAQYCVDHFESTLPNNYVDLISLPGIGRTTAGAILAFGYNKPYAILDGNVKRVLSRLKAITEPLTDKKSLDTLWYWAEYYTPKTHLSDYTQAIMDLGATLCTRTKPKCELCPFISGCSAYRAALTHVIPAKKRSKSLPTRSVNFLIFRYQNSIFLEKRLGAGVWQGLWSFPEQKSDYSLNETKNEITAYCAAHFKSEVTHLNRGNFFRHTFSHYHLEIQPIYITLAASSALAEKKLESSDQIWYNLQNPPTIGLPAPIKSLLDPLILL